MKIIKNNVPSKITSSKTHQPWITSETKKLKGTKGLRLQIQIEMLKFIGKSKVKHSGYAGASMTNMLMICFRQTRPTKRCGPI